MLALVSLVALAQDQEYHKSDVAAAFGHAAAKFEFETEYHTVDDLDFRALDESSDQSILDSDDKNAFAFSGIGVDLAYAAGNGVTIDVGASHRGLWGNDQIGDVNSYGGFAYVTAMSVDWTPMTDDAAAENPLRLRIGRQYYGIGGLAPKDFVLSDIIDGVRVDVPLGDAGHVEVIPLSIVSSAGDDANANFIDYIGQSTATTYGFRGDHLTRRYGVNLVLDGLLDGLDVRAYGFYTDISALGTGADISYDGMLGNFADNDWVANYGLRAGFGKGVFRGWGEFAGSTGIDRKELVAQDVNCNGFAYGLGALVDATDDDGVGPGIGVEWWEAWGPSYTSNGLMYSHGYVSMKGSQVGGVIADRFLGWHPSAYVGTYGVDNTPQAPDRKSGTRVIHAGAFYGLPAHLRIDADGWMMFDTGISELNLADLDTIVPPYGYSRAEFAAEERMGKALGTEIDGRLTWTANEHLALYANGGVLLPGSYYAIEISRTAGLALGGDQMAYDLNVGTRVAF
jgi:hypothetical protein